MVVYYLEKVTVDTQTVHILIILFVLTEDSSTLMQSNLRPHNYQIYPYPHCFFLNPIAFDRPTISFRLKVTI